jgi:ATP-dependent Clp protease protease subunit
MTKFWNVSRNSVTNEGEIRIYGEISEYSWWDTIGSKQFNEDLDQISDVDTLIIRINSPGGEVFAGVAIGNSIKNHKATNKKVYIDGIAASIASVIAMAGTEIIMYSNSMMMIHNPSSILWGTAEQMRKKAEDLDKIRDVVIATYQERVSLSKEELIEMLDKETYLTAEDALKKGFITSIDKKEISGKIENKMLVINGVNYDINKYPNFPVSSFLNFSKNTNDETQVNLNKEEEILNMAGNNGQGKPEEISVNSIRENHPEIYNEIRNLAITEERNRMMGIDEIAETTQNKELVNTAKKEGKTKEQLALDILNYQSSLGQIEIAKMQADSKGIEEVNPIPPDDKTTETKNKSDDLAGAMNKLRGGVE